MSGMRLHVVRLLSLLCVLLCGSASALGVCASPGTDGTAATISGVVNTYYAAPLGSVTAGAGSTSIRVGASSGATTAIAAGDLLLVVQMQDGTIDSSNTGAYGDGVGRRPARARSSGTAGQYGVPSSRRRPGSDPDCPIERLRR